MSETKCQWAAYEGCRQAEATPTDQRKAEEAVLRAAEAFDLAIRHNDTVTHPNLRCLVNAVRTLRSSRAPKPMKPEDVSPGTRFRFETQATRPPICKVVEFPDDNEAFKRGWMEDGVPTVYRFVPGDRIIPIEESDQ